MNSLVEKFGASGFAVLGVSCNQFGHQQQNSDGEILAMLRHIRPGKGFEPSFLVTKKVLMPIHTHTRTCTHAHIAHIHHAHSS